LLKFLTKTRRFSVRIGLRTIVIRRGPITPFDRRTRRPTSAGTPAAGLEDLRIGRPCLAIEPSEDEKGAASMSTQINVLETDVFGNVPAALIVLMTILAMLGIIAHVAMA
jgi:hypothetical protein